MFVLASLGIWTDDLYDAYDIKANVDRMSTYMRPLLSSYPTLPYSYSYSCSCSCSCSTTTSLMLLSSSPSFFLSVNRSLIISLSSYLFTPVPMHLHLHLHNLHSTGIAPYKPFKFVRKEIKFQGVETEELYVH